MTKLIAIDGDILVYQIALANERKYWVCNSKMYKHLGYAQNESEHSGKDIFPYRYFLPEKQVQVSLYSKLSSIFDDLGSKDYKMFITAKDLKHNFRSDVATYAKYKGNRTTRQKPHYYAKVRKLLLDKYQAVKIKGEEADDAIGKLSQQMYMQYGDYEHLFIASIDKDLQTIPGYHYHLKSRELKYVTEDEASINFHMQLVSGDDADNIPGLYKLLRIFNRIDEANKLRHSGYIKKFRKKLLDNPKEMHYNEVVKLYNSWGFEEDVLKEIGTLLWIRREDNDNWWAKRENPI